MLADVTGIVSVLDLPYGTFVLFYANRTHGLWRLHRCGIVVPEGQGKRRGNNEHDGSQNEREGIHCQPGDEKSRGLRPGAGASGDSVGAEADAIAGGAAAGGKAGWVAQASANNYAQTC